MLIDKDTGAIYYGHMKNSLYRYRCSKLREDCKSMFKVDPKTGLISDYNEEHNHPVKFKLSLDSNLNEISITHQASKPITVDAYTMTDIINESNEMQAEIEETDEVKTKRTLGISTQSKQINKSKHTHKALSDIKTQNKQTELLISLDKDKEIEATIAPRDDLLFDIM